MALPPRPGFQSNGFMNFLRGDPSLPVNNSDRLLSFGLGLLGGKTAQEQVALATSNLVNGQTLNKTTKFLQTVSPDLAEAVRNKALMPDEAFKLYYQRKLEAEKPQKPNLMGVGGAIYDADNKTWITPPQGAGSQEYGLNPQYGTDEQGNPVLIQLSKGGTAQRTPLPEGVQLSKEPIKLDAGTHFVLLDPITRQPIGQIQKDLAGAEAQKEIGKAQGEAQAAVPATRGMASLIDSQVQALKSDPYLPEMLGPVSSRLPNVSSDAARVQGKIDQLKGGAFLQARQMLKGGGAITDYEGQKAESAFARMSTAQSVEDFNAALDEFNAAVQQGLAKIEAQAGGGVAPASAPARGPRQTSTGVQWSVE